MSQLLGAAVQLQGADNFGRVEDAVIDDSGAIAYLVVSNNGRSVMLPWSEASFNLGRRQSSLTLRLNRSVRCTSKQTRGRTSGGPVHLARPPGLPERGRPPARGAPPAAPAGVPVAPGGVIDEKVKVKPSGKVKVKERVP